ncbi:MAG: GNAT family N-acetyltransferase [Candidatus Methylumidiphilus alinenensis]|uniref:GNAT family N-acetyltransferase n=1 Tax=Candidatus Methylumidiphilus alinenensis TaxID=2202197 RepID=A0A2W4RA70_9GAMM|nr:MAG: GNAT family N-acetyltransferase [Candidatus Methylumidiphilus alinenensis]
MSRHYLEPLFAPQSIAVFGANENPTTVGGRVYANLLAGGFAGPVYAINPKCQEISGKPCFASLDSLDKQIDLAVIAAPADTVADIIRVCGEHRVYAAIVLSYGFGELEGGADKQQKHSLLEEAVFYGVRILGPNCLGLMRPSIGLNATFGNDIANRGTLALVSQSGAICTAILDWASAHSVGFSTVISVGAATDVDFGDILDYLALDAETRGILMYVEGIRDARRFMSGLRAAARLKTVIVIKAGRHSEGSRLACSDAGFPLDSEDVFAAALERAGVVRADTVKQMFAAAQMLSKPHRVRGNRLVIITNAGGPGVLATDRALERGIELAGLDAETLKKLNTLLPGAWSHDNPVDILGDATPERYKEAVEACLQDQNVDGLLVMLAPQTMTQPTNIAKAMVHAKNPLRKPVLCCWLGESKVREGRKILDENNFPAFSDPESALEGFGFLAEFRRNQELLMQAPGPLADLEPPDIEGARLIIEGVLDEKRTRLSNLETRALLRAFDIPMLPAMTANSPNEVLAAEERNGRELLVSVVSDPVFGPVIIFGIGGRGGDILHDRSIALPPINELIARHKIGQTQVAKTLGQWNNKPAANIDAVVNVLLRVSEMVCELPQIKEMHINPLTVDEHGAFAIDAHIEVSRWPSGRKAYDHMAIHPYPSHLTCEFQLHDGSLVTIRPIRPEDAQMEQAFIRRLSQESKYFRFMESIRELSREMLVRFTQLDYSRELAFIAILSKGDENIEIGVARYFTNPDGESGEIALVVADEWQNLGLGTRLMYCIIDAAKEKKFQTLEGEVLANNTKMLHLMRKLGFSQKTKPDEPGVVVVTKSL